MASRSMYSVPNQFINTKSVNQSYPNNDSQLNEENGYLHNCSLWLNTHFMSFDNSFCQPFESTWIDLPDFDVNSINQLFTLIDLSFFIVCCITRENESVRIISGADFKTQINFHKVKEIDYTRLLVVIRDKIDSKIESVLIRDSGFSTEIFNRLEELDNVVETCSFSEINDIDTTEAFNISSLLVDNILSDCDSDLKKLDKSIVSIQQDWTNKQKRNQASPNRLNRLSQRIIDSLHNDIIKYLHFICVILERLTDGYSNYVVNISYFKLARNLLLEFQTELDEKQYQNIVILKHVHWQLEQRAFGLILEVKSSQLMTDNDEVFNCRLSPIKAINNHFHKTPVFSKRNSSILHSTPSFGCKATQLRYSTTDYNDLISEGDNPSVISLDSGILPASDNYMSLATSIDTIDMVTLPDESYETINGNEEYNYNKGKLVPYDDSDCLESISTCSDKDGYNSQTAMYSSISSDIVNSASHVQLTKNNISSTAFVNYQAVINCLHIPITQKDELCHKMRNLFASHEADAKFRCALSVTMYHARNNPSSDIEMTLEYLEETYFNFIRSDCRDMPGNYQGNLSFRFQGNNSACGTNGVSEFVSDFNNQSDQNTNNNADSKDDESNDLNTSIDDLANDLSIYAETDHQLALNDNNSLIDYSQASELFDDDVDKNNKRNSDSGHDSITNTSDVALSTDDINWQQYDDMVAKKSVEFETANVDNSLLLEDVELALRLSELHLRTEFNNEHHIGVDFSDVQDYNELNTVEEIDEELKTEFNSRAFVDVSLDDTLPIRLQDSDYFGKQPFGKFGNASCECRLNTTEDNNQLTFVQRVSLTLSLTDRLLDVTRDRLNYISSTLKTNDNYAAPKPPTSSKTSAIYAMRQRLNIVDKVLINLKYAIKLSYYSETEIDSDTVCLIEKLIADSKVICQFTYKLEEYLDKTDLDNADDVGYMHDLPDDLLVQLDPIDTESIGSLSAKRLHVTLSALQHYPCYDRLMNSSVKKFIVPEDVLMAVKTPKERKVPLSNNELIVEIHKLRRITAICALNIVDLHVIVARIEENNSLDYKDKVSELKELLLFWRIVDKECHRLLRCNGLIQHLLLDTKRTYVELVSLTAVMISIIRTVTMSTTETESLNKHLININSYKAKIIEWLNEIELCSSVVHRKRITHRRFKFFEDIHNYLEENLNSVTELADNIKLGCQRTVQSLTAILTYCSDLSSGPVMDIDVALNTLGVIDNRHLDTFNNNSNGSCNEDGTAGVVLDLEMIDNNISRLQHLLEKNRELIQVMVIDHVSFEIERSGDVQHFPPRHENTEPFTEIENLRSFCIDIGRIVDMAFLTSSQCGACFPIADENHILETATHHLTEKISTIATYAASNALLLYVDKTGIGKRCDGDTDQQISNWTSISQNEQYLAESVDQIVDEISSMLTASLIQNIATIKDDNPGVLVSYKLIFGDICHQLGDKALHFLAENILIDRQKIDARFVYDTSNDLAQYFSEELGNYMIYDCVNNVTLSQFLPKKVSCVVSCIVKLQQKISQCLLDKSVGYFSNFVGTCADTALVIARERRVSHHGSEDLRELALPVPTYRLSKPIHRELISPEEISTRITKMLQTDVMAIGYFHRDLRQQKAAYTVSSNSRITSDKISKLVAQFDRVATDAMNRSRRQSLELTRENKCQDEGFVSMLADVTEQFAKLSIISGDSYWPELQSSKIVEFCESKKIPLEYSIVGLDEKMQIDRARMDDQFPLSTLSENIRHGFESSVVGIIHDSVLNIGDLMTTALDGPILGHSTQSDQQSCKEDDDSLSVSEHSDLKSNDLETEMETYTVSDQRIVNSGERFEKLRGTNLMDNLVEDCYEQPLNCYMCHNADGVTRSDLGALINPSVTATIERTEASSNGHNCEAVYLTKPDLSHEYNANNTVPSYEASLSKLWIIVLGFVVVVLVIALFHDRLNRVCHRRLLLPKLVSSGLPF